MKDENNDMIMTEFIGIFAYSENVRLARWQMYAFDDKKDTKKAKGIKSNVIARSIINDYMSLTQMKWYASSHKIKIARSIYRIRNENRSESIRW